LAQAAGSEGLFCRMAQLINGEAVLDKAKRRSLALAIGLLLFSIYLLGYRGGFHSIDEVSMFAVTESLVKFGRLNTNQVAWTQWTTSQAEAQGFFGIDGQVYSKKGLALSLAQAPLYWLALNLPGLGMLQTTALLNAFITAATGLLLFMFLQRLHFSLKTAVLTTLTFGLVTIAIIYAKYLFSEPLAGLLLLLAAYMLFAYRQEGGQRHLLLAGLAAGFAVLSRANNLFLLPVFGLYLLAIIRPIDWLRLGQAILSFGLGLAVPGLIMLGYNALRSGDPFQTGYDLTLFSPNLLLGLYKLLFSPLRGLFVYSPILLLSIPGWWYLRRRQPAEAWLFAGLAGVTITLFSAWSSGEGLSWGSRFLVPVVPFFALSLAPLVETIAHPKTDHTIPTHQSRRLPVAALRATFYILLLLSFIIQLLGLAINPWIYLARLQTGFGGEFFLENTDALYYFGYSQMVGQLQAWSVENSDLAWWQPWGFDGLAFGLSLLAVGLSGWLLWRSLSRFPEAHLNRQTSEILQPLTDSGQVKSAGAWLTHSLLRFPKSQLSTGVVVLLVCAILPYILLIRYYQTDRQFGPPADGYTGALELVAAQAGPGEPIITVAQYHYHVPMNRFKARTPLLGFAQHPWPLPETAQPLLAPAMTRPNIWLVTVGFPPAAPDNAVEQWLATKTFKASDEWLPDEVRLVRFSGVAPTTHYPLRADFENGLQLGEVSLASTARAGALLPVEFTWRASTRPANNYSLFLQLLNPHGALAAQHDSLPVGGYALTTTWPDHVPIISRHALVLPQKLPPGDYRLIAGLYDPANGQRLALAGGPDFVELGHVLITQAGDNQDRSILP
jgi:hypothetical protein